MYCLAILLVLLGTGHGARFHVQFFGLENYRYFQKEYILTGDEVNKCHWLGLGNDINVMSVRTDGCIMLFSRTTNCLADRKHFHDHSMDITSIRVKSDTPNLQSLNSSSVPGSFPLACFSVCSREFGGGSEVDVDFYESNYLWYIPLQFRDVHVCRNLEKVNVGGKSKNISIDNHGHSIDLYEGEHCTGQTMTLPAGCSELSKKFGYPVVSFDVQSFRPTDYLDHFKLNASIYKFEFQNGTQAMMQSSNEQTVKLVTDTILRSNGAASMTQEFSVTGKVTTGMDYTTATGFSNMHAVNTQYELETKVSSGVPFVCTTEIKTTFTAGYQYQRSDSGSSSNKTSIVNEETISTRQVINVPPCTECVVSTFVKKVQNFPITYLAYSRVTGSVGSTRMSALEIKSSLRPDMKYLRDIDEYTVDAVVEGTMFAEFGLSSFIDSECKPISNCPINTNNSVMKGKTYKVTYDNPVTTFEAKS